MFKQETLIKKMFTFAGDDENYVQKGTKFYFFTEIATVFEKISIYSNIMSLILFKATNHYF